MKPAELLTSWINSNCKFAIQTINTYEAWVSSNCKFAKNMSPTPFESRRFRRKLKKRVNTLPTPLDQYQKKNIVDEMMKEWLNTGNDPGNGEKFTNELLPFSPPKSNIPSAPEASSNGIGMTHWDARAILQDMTNNMFPELQGEGQSPEQAADTIWYAWWGQVGSAIRPSLEFYEKHLPDGPPFQGFTDKQLSRPRGKPLEIMDARKRLLSIYDENGGMDAHGEKLPPPEDWPSIPPWFYRIHDKAYSLSKKDLVAYIRQSFNLPQDSSRVYPLTHPKKMDFTQKRMGPKDEPETQMEYYPEDQLHEVMMH